MFYQESQIKNILNCKKCSKKYDETNFPKLLPCGHDICSNCESFIKKANCDIKCTMCSTGHWIKQDDQLYESISLIELIRIKPSEIHRSNDVNELNDYLSNIKLIINTIESELEKGIHEIGEYCIGLRNQVQLATELRIQQINNINKKLINEINKFERECRFKFESDSFLNKTDLSIQLKSSNEFYTKWKDYLNQFKIVDDEVNDAKYDACLLVGKLIKSKLNLDNFIFNNEKLTFKSNNDNLDESIVGFFSSSSVLDTSILNRQQISKLLESYVFDSNSKWFLRYRGTRDGFKNETFHSKCDQFSKFLILIKTKKNEILGGYTNHNWKSPQYSTINGYIQDLSAFIFKFEDDELNKKSYGHGLGAIKHSSILGPCFGLDDINISFENLLNYYDKNALQTNKATNSDDNNRKVFFQITELEAFSLN